MPHELATVLKNESAVRARCSNQRSASLWAAAGGVISALGICSACCLLPALLIGVGVTGAWVSALDSLSRFKWYFVTAAVALIGYGLVLSYSRNSRCADSGCASCRPSRAIRIALWIGVVLAVAGLLFEMIEPLVAS